MGIGLLNSKLAEKYANFIDIHPESSIYHTFAWRRIIEQTYGYRPFYIVATHGEEVAGVLPLFEVSSLIHGRRLVSLPFSYCVNTLYYDSRILREMIEFAKVLTKKRNCSYLEIKHGSEFPLDVGLLSHSHFIHSVLDLSCPIDEIWRKFKKDVRKSIRKAEHSTMQLITGNELAHYRIFFELEVETRRKQGSPPYSFRFFDALYSILHPLGKVKLYLTMLNGQYIAGGIILLHKDSALFGYSASSSSKVFLRLKPNNFLFWHAIQNLHKANLNSLDFGITDPSNEGLLRFKSAWGTRNSQIPYRYFLNQASEVPVFDRRSLKLRIARGMLHAMPLKLLKKIGPVLLRQLG